VPTNLPRQGTDAQGRALFAWADFLAVDRVPTLSGQPQLGLLPRYVEARAPRDRQTLQTAQRPSRPSR
jgi:hypothetical protein